MQLTVAVQMDPLASINPRTDSTLLLMLEAQARGHTLLYYTPNQLSLDRGRVMARVQPVTLRDDPADWFTLGETRGMDLAEANVVLMRQDPPFDMAYITATHMLERLPATTLVANDPAAVRNNPEKLFPLEFPQFTPPTLISADPGAIRDFHREHREIVIKPLYGHGGRAVFRMGADDANLEPLLETLFTHTREPVIAQRFLPEVTAGDRRIILIDGMVGGAMGRVPAPGQIRANFRVGGSPALIALNPRERDIAQTVGAALKAKNLLLAGIDIIGDYLIEINITCPTGMRQMNALYGLALHRDFWNAVEKRF